MPQPWTRAAPWAGHVPVTRRPRMLGRSGTGSPGGKVAGVDGRSGPVLCSVASLYFLSSVGAIEAKSLAILHH